MFRRPFRRMLRRPMLPANPIVVQAVARANQLLANGNAAEAAQIFARLAQEAESRGRPKLAANGHAQAAHAFAHARDEANTLAHARIALNWFLQLQMLGRAANFFGAITQALRATGMKAAAELQKEFGDRVASAPTIAPRGRLPGKCPQCAAPVRSDEVDWIDNDSAECNYCGSVMQTEE